MAILNNKFYINLHGTTVAHNIYTTSTECSGLYTNVFVNNINGYIPLGSVGGVNTSAGRVTKGNATYALKIMAKPPYTEQSWTTAGTYTWTCPVGVTRVRVAVCGGGGGQGCSYPKSSINGETLPNGGNSTFGNLITATAGVSGYLKYHSSNIGGYLNVINLSNGGPISITNDSIDSEPNGKGYYYQYYGWECSFNTKQVLYGYGSRGEIYRIKGQTRHGYITSSSGGYNSGYVNVVPLQVYQVIVGNHGGVLEYNCSANPNGTIGGDTSVLRPSKSGFVLIAYGGDI